MESQTLQGKPQKAELLNQPSLSEDYSVLEPSVLKSSKKCILTEQEKYREASKTLQAIAEQMSHFGTEDFLAIMETFKNIKTQLTAGKRIKIKDHATQQGWTVA